MSSTRRVRCHCCERLTHEWICWSEQCRPGHGHDKRCFKCARHGDVAPCAKQCATEAATLTRAGRHRYTTPDGYTVTATYGWSKAQNPKPRRWLVRGPDDSVRECADLRRAREHIADSRRSLASPGKAVRP